MMVFQKYLKLNWLFEKVIPVNIIKDIFLIISDLKWLHSIIVILLVWVQILDVGRRIAQDLHVLRLVRSLVEELRGVRCLLVGDLAHKLRLKVLNWQLGLLWHYTLVDAVRNVGWASQLHHLRRFLLYLVSHVVRLITGPLTLHQLPTSVLGDLRHLVVLNWIMKLLSFA